VYPASEKSVEVKPKNHLPHKLNLRELRYKNVYPVSRKLHLTFANS